MLISTLRLESAIEWSLLICRTSTTMAIQYLQMPQVLWGCVTNRELSWGASGAIQKKPYGVHIAYKRIQTFKVLKLPLVWRKTTNFQVNLWLWEEVDSLEPMSQTLPFNDQHMVGKIQIWVAACIPLLNCTSCSRFLSSPLLWPDYGENSFQVWTYDCQCNNFILTPAS
jgi:hypothetical protein